MSQTALNSHSPHTALQLADYLLQKVNHAGGESINLLKLAALLYYAEAGSLAIFEQELVDEELQAWDHGPVFPSLWARLGSKGWNKLGSDELADCRAPLDAQTQGLLDDVWQAYGEFTQTELGKKIKQDEPWKAARRGLKDWDLAKRPMDKNLLASFYKAAFEATETAAQ